METAPGKSLLILGASARAAAGSARRRGRPPLAVDLFADLDLRRIAASWRRVPAALYPHGLPAAARELPPAPFIITGGLENHPGVVEAIEAERQNEGCPAATLRRIRDPFALPPVLAGAGLPCPRIAPGGEQRAGQRAAARWIRKPLRGAGGRGIGPWTSGSPPGEEFYLQELIEGMPCAAAYFGDGAGRASLLGVTRQLVGERALGAGPFAYSGSIGPLPLEPEIEKRFARLGRAIAAAFRPRGHFGVDAMLRNGVPWPVEINPRYTASVEVLERAEEPRTGGSFLGKAILFAGRALETPERIEEMVPPGSLADIPPAGAIILPGRPVLTVFASAATVAGCRRALIDRARFIERRLPAAGEIPAGVEAREAE